MLSKIIQRNGDVVSDRKDSVGGSSTSVKFPFSACGYGGLTKFINCNSNNSKFLSFNPLDKIVSSVTHRTILVQIMESLM